MKQISKVKYLLYIQTTADPRQWFMQEVVAAKLDGNVGGKVEVATGKRALIQFNADAKTAKQLHERACTVFGKAELLKF